MPSITIKNIPSTLHHRLKDSPLYALLAYAKSARTDLTPEERRTVATLAASIKAAARSNQS